MQDVKSLRHQAAIQILSALIVEDRIAWHKDFSCGSSQSDLIETAVDMAYGLVEELAKRDPVLASQLRSEQTEEGAITAAITEAIRKELT